MKTIAVVGPDEALCRAVAGSLRRCRAIPNGGPAHNPDGVVALVGRDTPEDREIVAAIVQTMGVAVVAGPERWASQPGMRFVQLSGGSGSELLEGDIAALQSAVDELGVDMSAWASDAQAADVHRAESVKLAVRLGAQRVASEIMEDNPTPQQMPLLHTRYVRELQRCVLEQGVAFPPVEDTCPAPAPTVTRAALMANVLAVIAAALGTIGAAAGVGRLLQHIGWGIGVGIVLAMAIAVTRWWMVRQAALRMQRVANQKVLRESWAALTNEVVARLQIPRISREVQGARP